MLILGLLVAQSGQPQLAVRDTGEFGPAAGQVLAPSPPPTVHALLDRLSRPPSRSDGGLFQVTLLCDSDGTPLRRRSLRAAAQGKCGLFGPGEGTAAAAAVGCDIPLRPRGVAR